MATLRAVLARSDKNGIWVLKECAIVFMATCLLLLLSACTQPLATAHMAGSQLPGMTSPIPQPRPSAAMLGELISPLPAAVKDPTFNVRAAAITAIQLYFSGENKEFQILLQRRVTSSELSALGVTQVNSLQEPPLELVLLQGEFDTNSMGRGALGQPAKYLVFVFNLDTRTITSMSALIKGDTIQPLLDLAAQVTPIPVTSVPVTP